MDDSVYVAASGAKVQQMRLEVLTNNLSNLHTTGFKEDRSVFRSYLAAGERKPLLDKEVTANWKVTFEGTQTDFAPGPLKCTGNPLDLGLEGKGFFCIQRPEGMHYTRKGNFTLDQRGQLVTQDGFAVMGSRGEITLEGDQVTVDNEGGIAVDGNRIDTLRIVAFQDPSALEKVGDTLFVPADPEMEEREAEGAQVRQGYIEMSNVNPLRAITEMIEVLRTFEAYQRMIQSSSDLTSQAIREVGRLA